MRADVNTGPLRWSRTTLLVFFATLSLSVYLFVIIPKGFFPQQDTGLITAASEAGQDVSFADMKRHQEQLGAIVQAVIIIYNVVMFVVERASQIMELIEAIMNSLSAIASGAIAGAANWIEAALGKS